MQTAILSGKIVRGMSFEKYQEDIGINASLLKVVHDKSLAHAKYLLDGNEQEDRAELSFGRAFHSLVLEGKRDFVVTPATYISTTVKKGENPEKPWNWNSNTCKAWRENQTLPILSTDAVDTLEKMVRAVNPKPFVNCQDTELSIFAEKNGMKLKARIDWLNDNVVVDFKTVQSANPESFVKMAYSYGYFLQAAFYLDMLKWAGVERNEFWLVAVEKEAPFATCTLKLKQDECGMGLIDLGRKQYQRALNKLKKAQDDNCWPGYGEVDAETVAPIWMAKELEQLA